MPLKSRRLCASQYFDCILLCGLYIGLHYTTFFEICTSWNPTGRPVAGLKHGFQGSQAVNISHHFVALKCSLEPPSNIARHSPRHHLYRAFPSKQKTTACWRSACRKKLAGLQCHHLRSCQHSIRRTFLSEKKCEVSPAETEWKLKCLFNGIGPIFRSCHECLLWDCMGGSSGPTHASFSRRGVSCINK